MPDDGLQRARFIRQPAPDNTRDPEKVVDAHFNPASLQFTITNTLKKVGRGNKAKQHVTQSTGKLTMELVFDTTHNGEDVRTYTGKVAKFMEPENKVPPVIKFKWGVYSFMGMVESYKETLDFFAANGVPLRAAVNLTLAAQDRVFDSNPDPAGADVSGAPDFQPPAAPGAPPPGGGGGGGATGGRFGASAGVSLGAGFSAGVGIGGSVGVSAGIGADVSAGLSISAGASASAGVSASAGAFGGLRAGGAAGAALDVDLDVGLGAGALAGGGAAAGVGIGGQAGLEGSASLKADVGAPGALQARIQFEEG